MSSSQNHTIQRQIIDVHLTHKKYATEVQDQLSEVYREAVIPMLDRICSTLMPGAELLRIDQLEIDVGTLNPNNLQEDFLRQVKTHLEEEFTKIVYKAKNGIAQDKVQFLPLGKWPKQSSPEAPLGAFAMLLEFFETGVIPWKFKNESIPWSKVQRILWTQEWPSSVVQRMKANLRYENIRQRVFYFIPSEHLVDFFEKVYPDQTELIFTLLEDVKQFLKEVTLNWSPSHRINPVLLNHFFNHNILQHSESSVSSDVQGFVQDVLKEYLKKNHLKLTALPKKMRSVKWQFFDKITIETLLGTLNEEALNIKSSKDKFMDSTKILSKSGSLNNLEEPTKEQLKNINKDLYRQRSKTNYEEVESFYPDNAGLILVWPYLQIFFRELGLLDERNQFKDETTQWKAVHLLAEISFGEERPEEEDFLLNKIICGLRPEDFVPPEFDLTETEKEECTHLLQVLISNWPVLKKTSLVGLQKTFIQREGILSKKHDGWEVQIERKAFDIVLERLTWPIAVIRLAWLNDTIHVKW